MQYSLEFFLNRSETLKTEIKTLEKKGFYFSLFRLLVFLVSIVFFVLGIWNKAFLIPFFVLGIIAFAIFIFLCAKHFKLNSVLKNKRVLFNVNEEYIARINGDFSKLNDKGTEFNTADHDYCVDLDIFGDQSLFALYNISESAFGREYFSKELLNAHSDSRSVERIRLLQEASHEFSEDIEFLQEYQALARQGKLAKMPKALIDLSDKENSYYSSKMRVATRILIALWIIPLIILFVFSRAFVPAVLGMVIINLIASFIMSSRYSEIFKAVDGISRQCNAIYKLFTKLESKGFKSSVTKQLVLGANSDVKISDEFKKLADACFLCSFRSQPLLALVLNSLCLFDSICADKFNSWIQKYGKNINENIKNLAQIESLMSTSVVEIISDYSCRPVFVEAEDDDDKNAYFKGVEILHPLLKRDVAVSNSIEINSSIAIITGSNMSGKTTLIRTVGTMAILSYIGAYVPAKEVKLGRMRIVSSMRIVDSIKEEMSTFRAELVRISRIVNAGRENKPMLFLIDEIFRGTNSADRTSGAMEVLRIMSKPMIIGFMTTHDYALCDEAKEELNNICYYHFSEKYNDDSIVFDYKLKDGMTKISNAKQLMKLVGIIL